MPKPLYGPTLRLKAGELNGISSIRESVKKQIRPHFIIPPKGERDESTATLFDSLVSYPDAGLTLSKFWRNRHALINPHYIYNEFGEDTAAHWLPALFESARKNSVIAAPVASLADLSGTRFEAVKGSLNRGDEVQLGLSITGDELIEPELKSSIEQTLNRLGLAPEACSVLLDFDGAYFEELDGVSEIIESALLDVRGMGQWETIVFQGSNYPITNPAKERSTCHVPRNEWLAWQAAVELSNTTPDFLVFGDYAADCAKMNFSKGGVQAIRHYRYATPDSWLIARAAASGKDQTRMQWVAEQIVESGFFAGRDFSPADEFIYRTAKERAGPGNSTMWRQINTAHHLTRVVHDIAEARGRELETIQRRETYFQPELI